MAPSQQMHLVANSSVQPRAAFVLSGHLRDTCDGVNGTNAIVKQAIMCHEAFAGRCDVFLHTWSTLEKHVSMLRHSKLCHLKNASDHCQLDMFRVKQASRASSVCVDTIARRLANELPSSTLGVSRTLIEEQPEPLSPAVGWGAVGEAVDHNMFFQVEGIARVLEMAARERPRRGEHRGHHAVVRMRADFGIRKHQARPELWLNPQGWRNVHLRAKAAANGMLDERVSTEVLTCGWPHFKRTDMCFWCGHAPCPASMRTLTRDCVCAAGVLPSRRLPTPSRPCVARPSIESFTTETAQNTSRPSRALQS